MKRIMIVDDEPDIVDFLAEIITEDKYQAIKVYSGEECLKSVHTANPDLILLDILMEPINGWEVLDKLKQDEKTKHIPVVVLTAKQLEIEDAIKRARNVSDYITKPVDTHELKSIIEEVLDLDARLQRVLEQARKIKISPQAIAIMEAKFIPTMRYYSTYKKLQILLKQIYTEMKLQRDEKKKVEMKILLQEIEKLEEELEKIKMEFESPDEKLILTKIEECFTKRPSAIEKFLALLSQQPPDYKLNLERVLILLYLKDGERRRLSEIRANLNEKMEISDRLTLYYLEDLIKSGLVLKEPHSMYKITSKGLEIASKYTGI